MNRYLLDMHCKQMGLTDEHIAQLLDINTATYYRKKVGKSDFTRKEMQKIRSVLNLTPKEFDDIFFEDLLT